MIKKKKPTVFGVGINDADYNITKQGVVDGVTKIVWNCPYYITWYSMIRRCYSDVALKHRPTYKGCKVSEEWLTFSNFRSWMSQQDWEGKQLDKDVLILGNKLYSSDTCVFVTMQVNVFLTDRRNDRGSFLIGVCKEVNDKKFRVFCNNPFTGKQEHIGYFSSEIEGHEAWLSKKLEHAYALAAIQTDPRVAKALIERYTNYKLQVCNNG